MAEPFDFGLGNRSRFEELVKRGNDCERSAEAYEASGNDTGAVADYCAALKLFHNAISWLEAADPINNPNDERMLFELKMTVVCLALRINPRYYTMVEGAGKPQLTALMDIVAQGVEITEVALPSLSKFRNRNILQSPFHEEAFAMTGLAICKYATQLLTEFSFISMPIEIRNNTMTALYFSLQLYTMVWDIDLAVCRKGDALEQKKIGLLMDSSLGFLQVISLMFAYLVPLYDTPGQLDYHLLCPDMLKKQRAYENVNRTRLPSDFVAQMTAFGMEEIVTKIEPLRCISRTSYPALLDEDSIDLQISQFRINAKFAQMGVDLQGGFSRLFTALDKFGAECKALRTDAPIDLVFLFIKAILRARQIDGPKRTNRYEFMDGTECITLTEQIQNLVLDLVNERRRSDVSSEKTWALSKLHDTALAVSRLHYPHPTRFSQSTEYSLEVHRRRRMALLDGANEYLLELKGAHSPSDLDSMADLQQTSIKYRLAVLLEEGISAENVLERLRASEGWENVLPSDLYPVARQSVVQGVLSAAILPILGLPLEVEEKIQVDSSDKIFDWIRDLSKQLPPFPDGQFGSYF